MTDRRQSHLAMAHRATACTRLTSEQLVAADGTIWSHAATLGTRIKGDEFTIDQAVIENFIRVFTSGYPSKVPVDYEHGTVNGATTTGQPVPKAGDVLELAGVFATSDFAGELKKTAEKLSELAGRPLDDPRNLGLWMRWKPTSRALGMIQGGEYSELSIAFAPVPHNTTGKDQGEVLISVALTNLPFLDDMLPVAASMFAATARPAAGDSAATAQREEHMTRTLTMLAAVAALAAKPVTNEEEAITELTAIQPEIKQLRALGAIVAKAFGGETDPAKVEAKITELSNAVTTHEKAAKDARALSIKTSVEATITKYEKRLTVPMRTLMSRNLTAELEAKPEVKVEETETVKALETMPDTGITERATGADVADPNASDSEKKQLSRVNELLANDSEIKELSRTKGEHAAYMRACEKAEEELAAGTT